MTIALILLATLMACFVGWLVKQSVNSEPWVATTPELRLHSVSAHQALAQRLALGVLLAVITSLFALFLSAYMMRMMLDDWQPVPLPTLLWINTGTLVLGSLALQWAWHAAGQGTPDRLKPALLIGAAFSAAFIAGQWLVWRQLGAAGYYLASNPANSFFYVLTGLHALHLLGGLVFWVRTFRLAWRGTDPYRVRLATEFCALYWHFLLIVWVVLLAILSHS